MKYKNLYKVEEDLSGVRIDRWIKIYYPKLSHNNLEKILRTGQIRVDGKRIKSNFKLEIGALIRIPPFLEEYKVIEKFSYQVSAKEQLKKYIIYEDKNFLAINKPPNIAVQGGTKIRKHLDGILKSSYKSIQPRLVHRLDKETSGVLLVAKNRKTANHLTYAFRMKKIIKHYWAITNGDFLNKNGIINIDIRGRNSEKLYSSLTYYHKYMKINNKLNWIIFRPITGRNHQIRIHSKSMGAPILGDKKYDNLFKESNNGLHLHSRSIEFCDLDGKKFFFEAPLPVHMVKTWKKYNLPMKSDFSGFKEFILES